MKIKMARSGAPSGLLHRENLSIELPAATSEDLQPLHSLEDNSVTEPSGEDLHPSHLGKGSTIRLSESPPLSSILLHSRQAFLRDDLQEPQELFHNVLGAETPQDLLLTDLEPRTQELLLHDMQPSHSQSFPSEPQEQLQSFVSPSRENEDLQTSLILPVDGFLAPLPQDLTAIGESATEGEDAAPSHLSASEYSDMSFTAEASTAPVVISTTPKMTQRLREKKKSKSVYKHVPHREKPQHLVARRNARERRRVQSVNVAFSRLRRVVPGTSGRSKRVSKVKTLQGAMDYIAHLQALLREPPDLCDGDFPSVCTPVPYTVYAPSVRIQVFRDTATSLCDSSNVLESEEDLASDHRLSLGSANPSYSSTCWGDAEVRTDSIYH